MHVKITLVTHRVAYKNCYLKAVCVQVVHFLSVAQLAGLLVTKRRSLHSIDFIDQNGQPAAGRQRKAKHFQSSNLVFFKSAIVKTHFPFQSELFQFKEAVKDCKLIDSSDEYLAKWLVGRI